jgi:hypothetical protein
MEYKSSWFVTSTDYGNKTVDHLMVLEKVEETKRHNTAKVRLKGRDE